MYLMLMSSGCKSTSYTSQNSQSPEATYQVVGQVIKPGRIPCSSGKNQKLTELISMAGGFTEFSYLKKIWVINDQATNIYNYRNILSKKDLDPQIPCGAMVIVRSSIQW